MIHCHVSHCNRRTGINRLLRLVVALSLLCGGLAGLPATPASAASYTITAVYDSFDATNISAFQLNGDSALGGSRLRLTRAVGGLYGTAWWKNKVSLQDDRSFSAHFVFEMSGAGGLAPGGADGLVFAIQTQSNGAGSLGGGMGYDGVTPSVGIEFDTWDNGLPSDANACHVGVDTNGSVSSVISSTVSTCFENGGLTYAWVDYDGPTDNLEVRLSTTSTRPGAALIDHTIDLAALFGADVYVGFTAATGGAYAEHDVVKFYFHNTGLSGGIDPDTNTYTPAPALVTLTASPTSMAANGSSTSSLTARTLDVSGSAVTGFTVTFSSTLGSVSPITATSNASGYAYSTLTSGTTAGAATLRATADGGAYTTTTVSLTNVAPTDIALSSDHVAENQSSGTTVGTLSSTDVNPADTHTYSLVAGAGSDDNASFSIVGNELRTAASFNYEADNSYSVRIRSTDSGSPAQSYEEAFVITIDNVNEPPTDIGLSSDHVAENQVIGTTVGTLSSTDPEAGDTHTYNLVSGAGSDDNASFSIVGNALRTAASFNYEVDSSYTVRVRSTDSGSPAQSYEEAFVITIDDVNEAPSDVALSNDHIAENQPANSVVGALSSTDEDPGDTHTYSLVPGSGADNNTSFSISGDNTLRTNSSFNYEAKSSYTVRVRSTDSGSPVQFREEVFVITIDDVNEAPTDIALSNDHVAENQPANTVVGTFSSTDPDPGNTHTYSLVSGAGDSDNALFGVAGNQLQTAGALNYEGQVTRTVRVRSTDSGSPAQTREEAFIINIDNANDAPADIALSNDHVTENQPASTVVGTFGSTDEDPGDTHSYSLVAGDGDANNGSFVIVGDSLQTAAVLNYEAAATRTVRVRSTDDGSPAQSREEAFVVYVDDVNEAPTDIGLDDSHVDENQPADSVVGTLTTTDEDTGDAHTYSLVAGDGDAGNASFAIVSDTLRTAASFNFEVDSSYTVRIRTTDDGSPALSYDKAFTITIDNVNDAPSDVALSNDHVDENQPAGTVVGTFGSTDEDAADTHTYGMVAGDGDADNASFVIVGDSLQTAAALNYEAQATRTVRVRSTDNGSPPQYREEVFIIAIGNLNDVPADLVLSNDHVAENQPANTVVGLLTTVDEDVADTHTYSLVPGDGDDDNTTFSIAGDDTLRTNAMLDFEARPTYTVRIRTTDSGSPRWSREEAFVIHVDDANDAPTDLALDNDHVAENEPAGTQVGTLSSTDQDTGDTHTYALVTGQGGTDNALFEIVGTALNTAAPLDYETRVTHTVRVRSTDSGNPPLSTEKALVITVDDANDYAPDAVPDGVVVNAGQTTILSLLDNDVDLDGDPLSLADVGTPENGTAVPNPDHTVSYTPAVWTVTGSDLFTYTVSDGRGAFDTASVTVVIVAPDDDPGTVDAGPVITLPTTVVLTTTGAVSDTTPAEPMTATLDIPVDAFPPGAVDPDDTLAFVYRDLGITEDATPANFQLAGHAFSLDAYLNGVLQTGFAFSTPITLTLTLPPDALVGLQAESLQLYWWDEVAQSWTTDGITMVAVDVPGNRVTVTIAHLTQFALFGQPGASRVYLPVVNHTYHLSAPEPAGE